MAYKSEQRHCWLTDHPVVEKIKKYSVKNQVSAVWCYFDLTEVKQLENVTVEHRPRLQAAVIRASRPIKECERSLRSQMKEQPQEHKKQQEHNTQEHKLYPQDMMDVHLCIFPISTTTVITMETLYEVYDESCKMNSEVEPGSVRSKAKVVLGFVSDEGGVVYQELSHGLRPLKTKLLSAELS